MPEVDGPGAEVEPKFKVTDKRAPSEQPAAEPTRAEVLEYLGHLRAQNAATDQPDDDKKWIATGLRGVSAFLHDPRNRRGDLSEVLSRGLKFNEEQLGQARISAEVRSRLEAQNEIFADLHAKIGNPSLLREALARHEQSQAQAGQTDRVEAARRVLERLTVSSGREASRGSEYNKPLVDLVSRAAEGRTFIHTDLPSGEVIQVGGGEYSSRRGFQTFGDGSHRQASELPDYFMNQFGVYNPMLTAEGNPPGDMIEAVVFKPATTGERPLIVTNPQTGQPESGVYFDYAYNPGLQGPRAESQLGLPEYRESMGNRTGNMLVVRAILPESVAAHLKAEIEAHPETAREVARQLVMERGGLDEKAWNGTGNNNPVRPPYDSLPAEHRVYLAEPPAPGENHWTVRKLER